VTVDTGAIQPGSLEAFSIYLHSLGDYWSHKDCLAELDAAGEPWGTHTPAYDACGPTPDAAHSREFGPPDNDTNRTVAGIHAIYGALKTRGLLREGHYLPIHESSFDGWLDQQMYNFVHNWAWDQADQRRALAQQIANRCQEIRTGDPSYSARPRTLFLPFIARNLAQQRSLREVHTAQRYAG
jgi:hypothetical protein